MKQAIKLIVLTCALLFSATTVQATNTLHVSSDGHFIVKEDGTPFFPQNNWATKLPWKLNIDQIAEYFGIRKAQGFNVITMFAVEAYDSSYTTTNVYGYAPYNLTSGGEYDGRWNPLEPIDEYWNNVEAIIDLAAASGIYVNLAPMPTELIIGSNRLMPRGDDNTAYEFANWIGQRFAAKSNIIWCVGAGKAPTNSYFNVISQFNAIAKGIADGVNGITNNLAGTTDYSTTLMTYDTERWTHSSSYYFNNQSWIDFNSIHEVPGRDGYPEQNQVYEITNDYHNLAITRPTWLLGSVFEGAHSFGDWQCRFQNYQTIFAGGFGCTYGSTYVDDFNENWQSNLNSQSALVVKYVTTLMTSSDNNQFLARVPDQSLLVGDTGKIYNNDGWYQTHSSLIQATRTKSGDQAFIYTANGTNISVNMNKLTNGIMKAEWFNPRDGSLTFINSNTLSGVGAPIVEFDPPGVVSNGNDWVLLLNFSAPPTPINPAVDITNDDATVTYDVATFTINGTNNANVVGGMIWSNQLTGAAGNFPAAPSWQIDNIALDVGDNIIVVAGSNIIGQTSSDFITISRGVPGTGIPTLNITNNDATVSYNTKKFTIGYIVNTNVIGNVNWINNITGENGSVDAQAGIIENIPLNIGSNIIDVIGKNINGLAATDSISIIRNASLATPLVDITTPDSDLDYSVTQINISGTNVNIVGSMSWNNQLTGNSGNISATQSWTINNIALNIGANIIIVTGTNIYGDISEDSVTITRHYESKIKLKVSSNGRFIVNPDGTPFFPLNVWATELPWKLSYSDAQSFIDQVYLQGFNMITIYSVCDYAEQTPTFDMVNQDGYAPFQTNNFGKWNPEEPINDYWNNIGNIIDYAAQKGMFVNLMPMPGILVQWDDAHRLFDKNPTNCYNFGNWIGGFFSDKTNLIWSLGGNGIPDRYGDYTPMYNAMAKGIADGVNGVTNNLPGSTDYYSSLMTFDSARWTHSSSYWFQNEEWLDFNSLHEVPGRQDHPEYNQVYEITDDYGKSPVKPTWLLGPVFEGNHNFGPWQCRFQNFQTVFAGGFGASYGNENVVTFDPGWDTNVDTYAANQIKYIKTLMTSVSNNFYLTRIPDQSILSGDTGEMLGTGWYLDDSDIIQATRTEYADHAMIYSANGRPINVHMAKLATGVMSAYWYNPRSGDWTFISDTIDSGGAEPVMEFDPPGDENEDGNDWVLVLNLIQVPEPTFIFGCILMAIAILRRR